MTHCATQHRARLWKASHSQPPASQRQKRRRWVFELQFWSVLLSSRSRKTAWVSVRFTPNPRFTVHTHPGHQCSLGEGTSPPASLLVRCTATKSSPVGTRPQQGPSLAFQTRALALSYMGIGAGISNINSEIPVAASTQGQASLASVKEG